MKPLKLNLKYAESFIDLPQYNAYALESEAALARLKSGKGAGSEFTGWLRLPQATKPALVAAIKAAAAKIREQCEALVVIGIGGSYLGAKAALDLLAPYYEAPFPVYFAGTSLSGAELAALKTRLTGKRFAINVISKSGTTTEPAIAYRILKELLIATVGDDYPQYIFATTDKARGALRRQAEQEGIATFVIPDDIGGRYSVLTPVGLLPLAVCGFDIEQILAGAAAAAEHFLSQSFANNEALRYAALHRLFGALRPVEAYVFYEPKLRMLGEWLKQLFGESEGKDGKGVLPISFIFSTDLHSLGQFIQEGAPLLFETVITAGSVAGDVIVPPAADNLDDLNYLAGSSLNAINQVATDAVAQAHVKAGVPVLRVELAALDEYHFGYLVYFFCLACAVSGYLLAVNPFDQPGVEEYKRSLFTLLGKPAK